MLDFMQVATKNTKSGVEVYPKFWIKKPRDLMIRGGDFYAIWDDDRSMWSTEEDDAIRLIDAELDKYIAQNSTRFDGEPIIKYMRDSDTGIIDKWHKYCQKQMRDCYEMLDEELIFSNTELTREKYASKKLNYPLETGSIEAFDKLIGTLYSKEERHKLEWAIGSIVSGDSKWIQKFMVLYGAAGTGKSTILNIIQQLFEGYYSVFDAKSLGSNGSQFALEAFRKNPLVAIQHDGDLSRIEDNTRLNSLVSHETMIVNEKYTKGYENRFKAFLFMGTNRAVKITDAKSGLLRRLIDVHPSGNKVGVREYRRLTKQISFELGAIAKHCLEIYLDDPHYYDDYVPREMMDESNDFYNFMMDSYRVFKKEDGTTLKAAWEMYKTYVEEAKVPYPFSRRIFKNELKDYFIDYKERIENEDGTALINYFSGFRTDKFDKAQKKPEEKIEENKTEYGGGSNGEIVEVGWLNFRECGPGESEFDRVCRDCPAQYAREEGTPYSKWEKVKTRLCELDTSKLHYAKVPEVHIVIDFDIKGPDGNKSFELNLEAASKWPATYAELSKSGAGIHLHYIYTGEDVTKLSRIYDADIEVKVFNGNSSLRRKLTKCNDLPIANINSGLPLKEGGKNLINFDGIKSERALRTLIKRHLEKEIMQYTKPSIDMIYKVLEEAYNSGLTYDVSDMKEAVIDLAMSSTNQRQACLKLVTQMQFKSEEASEHQDEFDEFENDTLVFYDVEVFPNLFLVCWKFQGKDKPVVKMFNPKPADIEQLLRFKLVGFNVRKYDNHMLHGCLMGYNNKQLYELSSRIVSKDPAVSNNAKFASAYGYSYTDVYDFAAKKQSLKKWEIELGIHHDELGLPWDEPAPEELWDRIADYCANDCIATEAVFNKCHGDFIAREILADLAGMNVNTTTNTLTTKIIFGNVKKPRLVYTDLATGEQFY